MTFDWFTEAEVRTVFEALPSDSEKPVILIGGQSISFWALYYDIALPKTDTPALTQDLDFVGGKNQAKALAGTLRARIKVATLDDSTPSTALLTWVPPHQATQTPRKLLIDFLGGVLGVRDKDVVGLAVPVQIDGLPMFRVLHPIICMQSRFANLTLLPGKRDANGLIQAQISIEIVRRYVEKDAARIGHTAIARAFARVFEVAISPHGVFAFHQFGLDAIAGIDFSLLPESHPFLQLERQKLIAKVQKKREIDLARRQGTVHQPRDIRKATKRQ